MRLGLPVFRHSGVLGLVLAIGAVGCGGGTKEPGTDGSGGSSSNGGNSSAGTTGAGASGGGSGASGGSVNPAGGSGNTGGSGGSGASGGSGNTDGTTASMELISEGVPAFASAGNPSYHTPAEGHDLDPYSSFEPGEEPAWLAYDLSGVDSAKRGQALAVLNALHCGGYVIDAVGVDYEMRPLDYTIETNPGAGGGDPPSDGWTAAVTITGSTRGAGQHVLDLAGANWIRVNISKSSNPAGGPSIEFDVYSAPNGPTDSWLLMGDSITYISTPYAWNDIPALVREIVPTRFPAVINAAIGGTSTGTAIDVIDETMAQFPGRYVALAYGTNDHANELKMEELVQKVIAAGKVPVVPHMRRSAHAVVVRLSGGRRHQHADRRAVRSLPGDSAGPGSLGTLRRSPRVDPGR
jgi:hypothetical protein